MSDPTALLQQLVHAVERLSLQQQELQTQFQSLKVSVAPPALPEPLPPTISPDALASLLAHPYLEDRDRTYARLLTAAFPLTVTDEDGAVVASAYAELAERIQTAMTSVESPPTPPRPSTPGRAPSRQSSDHVYVAKSGRRFDTRQPPPYPCSQCRSNHWRAGYGSTPCPSQPHFSRRGAPSPAAAPHSSIQAGPSV